MKSFYNTQVHNYWVVGGRNIDKNGINPFYDLPNISQLQPPIPGQKLSVVSSRSRQSQSNTKIDFATLLSITQIKPKNDKTNDSWICKNVCARGHPCSNNHKEYEECPDCQIEVSLSPGCKHSQNPICNKTPLFMKCQKLCERKCQRGHPCESHLCSEPCKPCKVTMFHTYPCHHEIFIACSDDTKANFGKCQKLLLSSKPSQCGHGKVEIPCFAYKNTQEYNYTYYCTKPCGHELKKENNYCGHVCQGICGTCAKDRIHAKCQLACGRQLVCGHICTSPCAAYCPPCSQNCEFSCEHQSCTNKCGQPCVKCDKLCAWNCRHKKCTKKCFEVCDRGPCNKPCKKRLICGHLCIGYCGELCPPLCFTCNKEELENNGLYYSAEDFDNKTRFIYLKDCKHTIEASYLTQWIQSDLNPGEIIPKKCPICGKRITSSRRFDSIIKANFNEIKQVQVQMFGDSGKIKNMLMDFITLMSSKVTEFIPLHNHLIQLSVHNQKLNLGNLTRMNFDQTTINYLHFLANIWHTASIEAAKWAKVHILSVAADLINLYNKLFTRIINLEFPLHMNQAHDIEMEFNRLQSFSALYDRVGSGTSQIVKNLIKTPRAMKCFEEAENQLKSCIWFDEREVESLKGYLNRLDDALSCTIGISEVEHNSVIRAFGGLSRRGGRWFKCPNGHIYVVTECGGAIQTSKCPECGTKIGGLDHSLLATNNLATEMDGSLYGLYRDAYQVEPSDPPIIIPKPL